SVSLSDTGIVLNNYRYLSKLNLRTDSEGKVTFDNKGEKVSWELYVPKNYNPKYPPGVFVFLHSQDQVRIPQDLIPLMEKYNMIWVSANNVGSEYPNNWREATTITGLRKVQELYEVDKERTYISGCTELSGWMSVFRTDLFKGAVQIDQVTLWRPHTSNEKIENASKNYFTFITGSQNLNKKTTKKTLREFKSYKFMNVKLMVVPGDVFGIPPAEKMDEAIEHVDTIASKKTYELLRKAEWAEKYKQYGKALGLYRQVASYNNIALEKVGAFEGEINKLTEEAEKAEKAKDYLKAYELYSTLSKKYEDEADHASSKVKSFSEDKKIINEIKSLSLYQRIEEASEKKIDPKKIIEAITNLVEKYPETEGAKKATNLLLNNGN
ncbi:MAG: hypothetical protein NE327_17075, partial [Lentisphaeraceae bacterium]|nr:hypothetical protein [Lentisphaeraceae bacterium]